MVHLTARPPPIVPSNEIQSFATRTPRISTARERVNSTGSPTPVQIPVIFWRPYSLRRHSFGSHAYFTGSRDQTDSRPFIDGPDASRLDLIFLLDPFIIAFPMKKRWPGWRDHPGHALEYGGVGSQGSKEEHPVRNFFVSPCLPVCPFPFQRVFCFNHHWCHLNDGAN